MHAGPLSLWKVITSYLRTNYAMVGSLGHPRTCLTTIRVHRGSRQQQIIIIHSGQWVRNAGVMQTEKKNGRKVSLTKFFFLSQSYQVHMLNTWQCNYAERCAKDWTLTKARGIKRRRKKDVFPRTSRSSVPFSFSRSERLCECEVIVYGGQKRGLELLHTAFWYTAFLSISSDVVMNPLWCIAWFTNPQRCDTRDSSVISALVYSWRRKGGKSRLWIIIVEIRGSHFWHWESSVASSRGNCI